MQISLSKLLPFETWTVGHGPDFPPLKGPEQTAELYTDRTKFLCTWHFHGQVYGGNSDVILRSALTYYYYVQVGLCFNWSWVVNNDKSNTPLLMLAPSLHFTGSWAPRAILSCSHAMAEWCHGAILPCSHTMPKCCHGLYFPVQSLLPFQLNFQMYLFFLLQSLTMCSKQVCKRSYLRVYRMSSATVMALSHKAPSHVTWYNK